MTRTYLHSLFPTVIYFSLVVGINFDAHAEPFESNYTYGSVNLGESQNISRDLERIIGTNNMQRISIFPSDHPFRKTSDVVGRLDIERSDGKTVLCTATLVDIDIVLTNYHCIPGKDANLTVLRASLLMGYLDETKTSMVRRYPVEIPLIDGNDILDFSLLKVKGRPGEDYGYIAKMVSETNGGDQLVIFHHPRGLPKTVTYQNCNLANPPFDSDGSLIHYCDTEPGSSGAAILNRFGRAIVGLHFAGMARANFAKPIREMTDNSNKLDALLSIDNAISVSSGLVAHFPFEVNLNNQISDATKATSTGSLTYSEGVVGKALAFNGNSHVTVPIVSGLDKPANAISAWLYLDSLPSESTKIVVRDAVEGGWPNRIFQFSITPEGFVRFLAEPNGKEDWLISAISKTALSVMDWHHVVVSVSDTAVEIFVDGSLNVTVPNTRLEVGTGSVPYEIGGTTFGHSGGGTGWGLKGRIDEIRIYSRPLSGSEVADLYGLGAD